MVKIALLLTCIASGFLLKQTTLFDQRSPLVLNNLIVYFFIPVLTLYHIPKIEFRFELIWLSITPFIVYLFSFLFFRIFGKHFELDHQTEGALIMTSGIGSISFVGFPVFEILYGGKGLALGIILSLAGTLIVFNTLGISTGLYYANKEAHYRGILVRILTFPPLLVFLLALGINFTGTAIPESMDDLLFKLSAPFSVLALLAIGMQIDLNIDLNFLKTLLIGQFYKLLLAPLIIYIFMWHIVGVNDLTARICLLGAAIGSMNTISIVAAQMGLNPKLSALMPAIGIPVSIPILFIIDFLIQ